MRKPYTFLKFTVLIMGLLLISACSEETREPSPYTDVDTLENVALELENDSYEQSGDTFLLTVRNDSENEVTYGVAFTVEKEEEGDWYIVEPEEEMAFILIAHVLAPGEEAQEEINMEYYEPFDSGHYRLVRQLEGEVLTAEFEVR